LRSHLLLPFLLATTIPAFAQSEERWGAEDIRRSLVDWLQATGRDVPQMANIGPLDPRISLPACEKVDVAPRGTSGTTFTLRCDGPSPWQQVLRVDNLPPAAATSVRATENAAGQNQFRVIVPKVDLPAGAILSAGDLEERMVNVTPGTTAIRSISDVVGLRLLSSISPGVALTSRHVARAHSVTKGENVTLIANGSGFQISVPGRAEQDGFEGDVITVRNNRTGATLKGRIERGKTVSVFQM
jgi:flagella basal body P-ring formation protein FlgA